MPTFTWEATDAKTGERQRGEVDADSPAEAAALLRGQGLSPTRISRPHAPGASPEASGPISVAPFLLAVPLSELAAMFRQCATLLRAGVPVVQAMSALAEQARPGRLREILREAASSVAAGQPFSATLSRHPAAFSPLTLELIKAGEHSGQLDLMCTRIADYLEREIEIRRKLKRETLYPKIVLFIAGGVLLLLAFLRAGMGSSGIAAVWARLLLAMIVAGSALGLWWLGRFLNQFPAVGAFWDELKLSVPGVGGVARSYATARFCRALGTLYSGGILLQRAVEISARACGNRAIAQAMLAATPALMEGGRLSELLARSGLLSPIAVQMARTGEQTGSIDSMMDNVADHLEGEADVRSHQLAVGAGVAILLIAALVVASIAISFYGGMMGNMTNAAGGGEGG